jgi:hypothetical protein
MNYLTQSEPLSVMQLEDLILKPPVKCQYELSSLFSKTLHL